MSIIRPTFFGLYTARSGVVANQANLDVTAQNMTNILTPGYTRQRADLVSVGDSGYSNRFANSNRVYIGQGVDVNGISQLRDAGYDLRYRQENCKYGYEETKLSAQEDLSRVLDEYYLKDGGINTALEEFMSAIQTGTGDAGDSNSKQNIRAQLDAINKILRQTSSSIDSIYQQQQDDFEITVEKINLTLEQIASLDKQIKEDALYNNPALELKDSRNTLLDQLSGYLNVEYKYDPNNQDELSIDFLGADGVTRLPLVQGDKFTTLSLHTTADSEVTEVPHLLFQFAENMKLGSTITPPDATSVAVTGADCNTGAVGAYFDILTGNGNFGADTENRGVPYYQNMLDTFANTLAQKLNDINRGKVTWQSSSKAMTMEGLKEMTLAEFKELRPYMTANDGQPLAWQNADGTGDMADWDSLNQENMADFLEANKSLIENGVQLAQGSWQDINGSPLDRTGKQALSKEQVRNMVDADGGPIQWHNQQGGLMTDADWDGLSEEGLAALLSLPDNQTAMANGAYVYGKDRELVTANDGNATINAGNIILSEAWNRDAQLLTHTLGSGQYNGSDDNLSRILTMLEDKGTDFVSQDGKTVYTGSIRQCAANIMETQGRDEKLTKSLAANHAASVNTLDENRQSISGVDENEETANMMMYQKAFTASSRILTAMDEMLDKLINSTGVVGR